MANRLCDHMAMPGAQQKLIALPQRLPPTRRPLGNQVLARAGLFLLVTLCALPLGNAPADPADDKLIENDWRKQDGIGTQRAPATFAVAIARTLERGQLLVRDLQASGLSLPQFAAWQALGDEWHEHAAALAPDDPALEDLWRRIHQARRSIALANPIFHFGSLLFVEQVPSMFSHQLTQYYGSCARPGGGVFVLDNPGFSLRARRLAPTALPLGSFQHPEVSCDGQRILFAYVHAETTPPNRESHLDRFYHLYEMAANGTGLHQLTEGPYDDFAPRYLPDGKIIFISTRRGGFHRCGQGPCPIYTLAIAEPDGANPHPVSFHETHEWDPVVANDGRILYTRWDYVDRHAVYYEQLWSTRPDGTDPRIYYGNNTFNPVGVWEARPVPGSGRVMATAAAHHAMTAGSVILLDVQKGVDGPEPVKRLTPDALFPESEAPVAQRGPGTWHAPAGVARAPATPVEQARWPGHCYRSPCPLSETYFLAAYSFDALLGEPEANPPAMFGLYLVDAFGNKELLFRDPDISSLWPVPLRARPRPPVLPSLLEPTAVAEGAFIIQDIYRAWPALPPGSVKRLRILQVLPKSTWHANDPRVGLANGSPGKQVLGTVPVEADGSAYFRAPAKIPLAFQALDEHGEAVQVMRSVTYLQPGETAACVGCHEPRLDAPSATAQGLACRRVPSTIQPGPDGSRPFSYPLLVQPVLDRQCVRCHDQAHPGGGVLLTGEPEGAFSVSYNALAPRVSFSAWGSQPGDFREANSEPLSKPGFFGARGSSLMRLLREGHREVKLEAADLERLATWMDANALFYGTFDKPDQARQRRGERIAGPALE